MRSTHHRPSQNRPARRRIIDLVGLTAVAVAASLIGSLFGGSVPTEAQPTTPVARVTVSAIASDTTTARSASPASSMTSLPELRYLEAVDEFREKRLRLTGAIAVADSVVASAQLVLDGSALRVIDENARAVLAASILREQTRIDDARRDLDRSSGTSTGHDTFLGPNFGQAARELRAADVLAPETLASVREQLADPVQRGRDATALWEAEQARLAAEAAARAAAEAEAARAAAAAAAAAAAESAVAPRVESEDRATPRAPSTNVPGPSAGTSLFNKYVWASGFQTELDACKGAVDLTGSYGVNVIGEHWSCGGSRFPGAGTTITLSGTRSGTYLVGHVAAVLNAGTDGRGDIPRGYDLLFQTCINGSDATMSFTVLTRVG